eukprot:TRINITY_DN4882_c0_g1_i2.p1 TRINITY_DN4882_c0_g1~~TRINITY_DN4882_c0_g1_i2.p1  ORF type:complete len:312 (-),score=54.56 TRINITY_DN4882_c0_g1_i2:43-978(-)
MLSFLAEQGVLIMPCEGSVLRITRTGPSTFEERALSAANFAALHTPAAPPKSLRFPKRSSVSVTLQPGPWEGYLHGETSSIQLKTTLQVDGPRISGKGNCSSGAFTVTGAVTGGAPLRLVLHFGESQEIELSCLQQTGQKPDLSGSWTGFLGSGIFSLRAAAFSAGDDEHCTHAEISVRVAGDGSLISLPVNRSACLHVLKRSLLQPLGIAPACGNGFWFVYNGEELLDERSCASYKIPSAATLYLVERPERRPGKSHIFGGTAATGVCAYCGEPGGKENLACAECSVVVHGSGDCCKNFSVISHCRSGNL